MPDFMLEPDELEPDEIERPTRRPVRLVSTGLADTAEVPRSSKPEPPPCYAPCEACGAEVLTGSTALGLRVCLDIQHATYTVVWPGGTPEPVLQVSRAYPVHRCH